MSDRPPPPTNPTPDPKIVARAFAHGSERVRVALELLCGGGRAVVHPAEPLPSGDAMIEALARVMEGHEPFAAKFDVEGGLLGSLFVLVDSDGSQRLASALLEGMPAPVGQKAHESARRSALEEAANIVASSFLSGLASAAKCRLLPSTPDVMHTGAPAAAKALESPPRAAVLSRFEVTLDLGRICGAFVAASEPDAPMVLVAPPGSGNA